MLITVEGVDGVGKTTLLKRLPERLKGFNKEIIYLKSPGSTAFSNLLRSSIIDTDYELSNLTILLTMLASINNTIDEVILPALEEGKIVIMDRFLDSTYVYQVYNKGSVEEAILKYFELGLKERLTVDKTFLVITDLGTIKNRINSRGSEDRFDKEVDLINEKINGYRKRIVEDTKRFSLLANTNLSDLELCVEVIANYIEENVNFK